MSNCSKAWRHPPSVDSNDFFVLAVNDGADARVIPCYAAENPIWSGTKKCDMIVRHVKKTRATAEIGCGL